MTRQSIWISLLGCDVRQAGRRFRGRCLVSGDGPPLLLLHGQGGHLENFSRNVTRLSQAHTVYAPDCVWHGLGPQPPFDPRLIPGYLDQLLDLIEAENLGAVSVLGQSMGGWTAMRLAIDHPDLVEKLVLVNPQGIVLPAGDGVRELLPAPGGDLRDRQLPALEAPTEETVRERLASVVANPDVLDQETVGIRLALYRRPATNASLRMVLEAYMAGPGSAAHAFAVTQAELASIRQPTLLLWGEQNMVPASQGRRIAASIPGAQLEIIAGVGHWLHFEAPGVHDRMVETFLQQ